MSGYTQALQAIATDTMGNSQAKSSITHAQRDYLLDLFSYGRQVEKFQHHNKRSRSAALELIVAIEQLSMAAAKNEENHELHLYARVVEKKISFWQRNTFTDGLIPKDFIWARMKADDIFK